MKLKTVFIIFNVVVGVTFLLVFIMPLLFLGPDVARMFWRSNWYMALLFIGALGFLNGYFISNWRFFGALEQERWAEIAEILGARLRRCPWFRRSSVKLFVNACVVSSQPQEIQRLEEDLRKKCPSLVRRNALRFGIPHLLSNDGEKVLLYFREFRPATEKKGLLGGSRGFTADEGWIEWCYAFGLLMTGRTGEARLVLDNLVRMTSPGIVQALSLYLLSAYEGDSGDASAGKNPSDAQDPVARDDSLENSLIAGVDAEGDQREHLLENLPREKWDRMIESSQGEIHVIILGTLLQDVACWLYGSAEREKPVERG
ncbi:hypothetical protein [Alkalispirochaeta americana]|uniref:hypothetical protein n=1 Tax=Alkalispirochaeta americana TaxID=159291 RepID=UPI00117A65C3|nr:hypothetical protein [Alkalispirochaeta americana]